MKTKLIPLKSETIQAFAERHDLTMEIRQRHHENNASKWYAHFEKCDIKEGSCLLGAYSDGFTPLQAIAHYAQRISMTTIVIDAFGERREINVPQLV